MTPALPPLPRAGEGWGEGLRNGTTALTPTLSRTREREFRATRFVEADTPVDFVLANDVDIESIEGELGVYKSIALVFPTWTDGRAYSQARLLRARYRFAGEIRATGEVLVDMVPLLARTGFDAVALRADQSREVAERALVFFADGHYQGDIVEPLPRFRRGAEAPA